jgi:hypothetical protein
VIQSNRRSSRICTEGARRHRVRAPSCRLTVVVGAFTTSEGESSLARYEQSPRHVVEARYLGDYKVWLEFNDGRKGVVDLADELYGAEMSKLRDRDRFCQFYLDYGLASIAWLDGQDFASEFLYDKLKAMH